MQFGTRGYVALRDVVNANYSIPLAQRDKKRVMPGISSVSTSINATCVFTHESRSGTEYEIMPNHETSQTTEISLGNSFVCYQKTP